MQAARTLVVVAAIAASPFSLAVAQEFTFPARSFFAPIYAGGPVASDLDGDGDLDLAFGNPLMARVEIHWNDGEGVFTLGPVHPILGTTGTSNIGTMAATDVDNDGDVDLIVGIGQISPCGFPDRLLRNLGGGVFVVSALSTAFDNTTRVLPFDFDNDGDQDVLQVNLHNSFFCTPWSTRLLRNDGTGAFADVTAAVMPAAPFGAGSAAILDVQGDGWLDVAFDGGAVFVNNGGQLAPGPALPVALRQIGAGDLDGDGDDDLFGADGSAVVALRNSGGTFAVVPGPVLPTPPQGVLASDVDGDGDLDLWIGSLVGYVAQPPRLWRQDPGMVFVDVSATSVPAVRGVPLAFFDSDGDGDPDLLQTAHDILHNDGTGRFVDLAPTTTPAVGRAADLDGDGWIDVVATPVPGAANTIGWWRGGADGLRYAGLVANGTTGGAPAWIVPLDIDGDGDLDVFAGSPYGSREQAIRNDGGGVFTDVTSTALPAAPLPPAGRTVKKVVAADFDGDGDVDVFVARGAQSPTSPQDSLYRNDGTGVFADVGPTHFVDNEETVDAVGLDFDRDGDVDLAVVAAWQPFRLFANDGAGHFTDVTAAHAPAVAAGELLAADVDGDGDDDLVLAASPPRLLRNDAGAFTDASSQLPAIGAGDRPLATDFDDDGDLDLVIGGQWLRNDGTGVFTATGVVFALDVFADELVLADVDDDGDPDVLGAVRNRHRQLENALPPRLGLHGELHLHARSTAPGWPATGLLLLGAVAAAPIPAGALGTLHLDLTSSWLHSAVVVPAGGPATIRYLCPANPALLGGSSWAQTLVLHAPDVASWRLGNLVALRVQL